jgi:hypothetical protein
MFFKALREDPDTVTATRSDCRAGRSMSRDTALDHGKTLINNACKIAPTNGFFSPEQQSPLVRKPYKKSQEQGMSSGGMPHDDRGKHMSSPSKHIHAQAASDNHLRPGNSDD